MDMISDLRADGDRCKHCGCLLHRHYGGKRIRRVLTDYDGSLVIGTWVDIRCRQCRGITSVFYQADMLPEPTTRQGRFAAAA